MRWITTIQLSWMLSLTGCANLPRTETINVHWLKGTELPDGGRANVYRCLSPEDAKQYVEACERERGLP